METTLKLIRVNARCAVILLEDGGLYECAHRYEAWLNGQRTPDFTRCVTPLYNLVPATDYLLRLEREGMEPLELRFRTEEELLTLDVRAFGARGDGLHDDTAAIQAAILSCPPGGRVLVPQGDYQVGALFLKSHLRLELQEGARLLGQTDRERLPVLPGMTPHREGEGEYNLGSWEGNPESMYAAMLTGLACEDVQVYGPGVLDGQAGHGNWWHDAKRLRGAWRPRMVFLNRCREVALIGLQVQNSPSWNIHPYFSEQIDLLALNIRAEKDSPNTDGIDPESCEQLRILGVHFSVGDDCIALKSGKLYMGQRYKTPCRHVHIAHCLMQDGHGAVTIGSEMAGGVQDVLAEHCLFLNTDRGLRIKTRRGRGEQGRIHNSHFRSIRMQGVLVPVTANAFYKCDPDGLSFEVQDRAKHPVGPGTPSIGTLLFQDLRCEGCHQAAAYLLGLPENPIERLVFRRVFIRFDAHAKAGEPLMTANPELCLKRGIIAENVKLLELEELVVEGAEGPALEARQVGKLLGGVEHS